MALIKINRNGLYERTNDADKKSDLTLFAQGGIMRIELPLGSPRGGTDKQKRTALYLIRRWAFGANCAKSKSENFGGNQGDGVLSLVAPKTRKAPDEEISSLLDEVSAWLDSDGQKQVVGDESEPEPEPISVPEPKPATEPVPTPNPESTQGRPAPIFIDNDPYPLIANYEGLRATGGSVCSEPELDPAPDQESGLTPVPIFPVSYAPEQSIETNLDALWGPDPDIVA